MLSQECVSMSKMPSTFQLNRPQREYWWEEMKCQPCNVRKSVRDGSFFLHSHMMLKQIIILIYCWSHDMPQMAILHEAEIATLETLIERLIKPGSHIISDGWAVYGRIDTIQHGIYMHSVVVHQRNSINPDNEETRTVTQNVETCGWEPRGNCEVNLAHLGFSCLLIYTSSCTGTDSKGKIYSLFSFEQLLITTLYDSVQYVGP